MAAQMNLHGSVEVPRAALVAFRDFLDRFRTGTIEGKELAEKMRWLDSLLKEEEPKSQWTPEMSEAAYRSRMRTCD